MYSERYVLAGIALWRCDKTQWYLVDQPSKDRLRDATYSEAVLLEMIWDNYNYKATVEARERAAWRRGAEAMRERAIEIAANAPLGYEAEEIRNESLPAYEEPRP